MTDLHDVHHLAVGGRRAVREETDEKWHIVHVLQMGTDVCHLK